MVELVAEFESMPPVTGSTDAIADLTAAFLERGVTQIQVRAEPNSIAGLDRFAPVLEAFRERVRKETDAFVRAITEQGQTSG